MYYKEVWWLDYNIKNVSKSYNFLGPHILCRKKCDIRRQSNENHSTRLYHIFNARAPVRVLWCTLYRKWGKDRGKKARLTKATHWTGALELKLVCRSIMVCSNNRNRRCSVHTCAILPFQFDCLNVWSCYTALLDEIDESFTLSLFPSLHLRNALKNADSHLTMEQRYLFVIDPGEAGSLG